MNISFLKKFYRKLFPIVDHGRNNTKCILSSISSNFYVDINGNNNSLTIGKQCVLSNTQIHISGDNNTLIFDDKTRLYGPCKIIMTGNSTLHIGENTGIRGVEFNLCNGNVEVGKLCMFSYGIVIRNHDSHKVLSKETGDILNPSKDVKLGNHVWIAQNASILKGCTIGSNSVIAFGAVVTKSCNEGCIVAGNPAKVVKNNITWDY